MKPLSVYYRLFIVIAMALAIFHPTLQVAAAVSLPSQNTSQPTGVTGSLENGLNFTFISSAKLHGGTWIKLTCAIPTEKEKQDLSLLTQHALFYGTKQHSRPALVEKFQSLGLDIEPDSYLESNESEKSLHFSLANSEPETVRELLKTLHEIAFHPTLKTEDIELARNQLLTSMEQSEEGALSLQSVTASELQEFYAHWYRPENMHLTLIGLNESKEILPLICTAFDSEVKEQHDLIQITTELPPLSQVTERVEWTQDHQYLVIDGKIWMKEPNWINKSSNGKTLGAILTILGIGGIVLAFPLAAPVVLIAGGLTTTTGVYFLASNYFKDPNYIESMRQIDLQKGCAFAYKHSRAGLTLTPYERRALFLQEMVDHPQTLPKLPILLLSDLYQLNDPVIAEIFTVDEFNVITRLKRDFVQQRNQYKTLKENLERELTVVVAPYALARDAALSRAQEVYRQNYFIVAKQALQVTRDESIADIERAFRENRISLDEKTAMIEHAHAYYEACISAPDFKAGLASAEITLVQMETEIQTTYAYQVELCKQSIQYNQRMSYYHQGVNALIHFYDHELNGLLATFPVYYNIFPDYLDLRSL